MTCYRRQADSLCYAAFPREPVSLRRLFPSASFVGCADIRVRRITQSPEESSSGTLFMPPVGDEKEQAAMAARAVRYGASALLVAGPIAELPVPQCVVRSIDGAFVRVRGALAEEPLRRLRTVGITGCGDGKLATALINTTLASSGRSCQTIHGGDYVTKNHAVPATVGFSDADLFWQSLARIPRGGIRFATLDMTGETFDPEWICEPRLEVAAITRLNPATSNDSSSTGSIEEPWVRASRRTLGLIRPGGTLVVNLDDPAQSALAAGVPNHIRVVSTSLQQAATITARGMVPTNEGTRLAVVIRNRRIEISTQLTGHENLSCCLVAIAVLDALGLAADEIAAGLCHADSGSDVFDLAEVPCAPVV